MTQSFICRIFFIENLKIVQKKTKLQQCNSVFKISKIDDESNLLTVVLYLIPDSVSQYLIFQ